MGPRDQEIALAIKEARQGHKKQLSLSRGLIRQALEEIPEEIFKLSHLEELDLYGHQIRSIPERIRDLPNLRRIDLGSNPVESVPDIPGLLLDWDAYLRCRKKLSRQNILGIHLITDKSTPQPNLLIPEITTMPNLRELSIGLRYIGVNTKISKPSKTIKSLIEILAQLEQLERLTIIGLLLREVPSTVRGLKRLRKLHLINIGLSDVPDWLSDLQNLNDLSLGINHLKMLPDSLADLPHLERLDAFNNQFTTIPDIIFQITPLKELNISNYRWLRSNGDIKQIPEAILKLKNLHKLIITGHSIETPPPEVVEQGLLSIQNYWRQQQESGVDYLCEAKLIIVGEAGAGKTSLAKKLKDQKYKLQPQESSTEGIEVLRWRFPAAVRVRRDSGEEVLQCHFKVNIWDFGGQEIYHATHQFFLSRRSLYVLVSDDRKEDTDFQYWLHIVELLSDRSPLLIVQNQKQDRQRDIDLGSLRARFPILRGAYGTNLATNRGLSSLISAIQHELERLPHIGTPLPRTWSRVRAALEEDARNYISAEEYLDICQRNGFIRIEDKLQLSGYLHDLGICLHFQDDPVLKKIVILKPKWGTDAVYRILDDHTVLDHHGRFSPQDLKRIWAEDTYAPMRDELLRLMMKFQLCYPLADREEYIAPQLLSPTRPEYTWDGDRNLVLRYDYEFMPKGLITRFIVAINHLITNQSLVWKSGVVIERAGTRGEVIEDYSRRKITVRVSGPDTRGLLAIVDDQLDRIHRSFPRLKYEKFLPCNCEVCRARSDPYAYPLSELSEFAQHADKIQCRTSRKLVDSASLIRDVLPSAVRADELLPDQKDFALSQESEGEPSIPAPELRKEVFVSYSWAPESKAVVDKLESAFRDRDIVLVRERNELKYKHSIREFMKRMGRGKCIVVVLSKQYLESKNCMLELTELAEQGGIWDRVFPIVMENTNIYDASGRLDYIDYWEQKSDELDAKIKKVKSANLHGIREEMDLYAKIRETIARLMDLLGDMNALTPEQHLTTGFEDLLRALDTRLSE